MTGRLRLFSLVRPLLPCAPPQWVRPFLGWGADVQWVRLFGVGEDESAEDVQRGDLAGGRWGSEETGSVIVIAPDQLGGRGALPRHTS